MMLNGKPTIGFELGSEAGRIHDVLRGLIEETRALTATLSAREALALQLGLATSHLEESLAQGAWTRAEAHAENVAKLMGALKEPVGTTAPGR